ncbi:MAG: GeoRSP system PqqD family peptide chaperone [Nitrospiraceae bacterium]|nr:GeoRSP system PqqD family peptide chaperone [Nitrospiraceae bacterium]
MRIFRNPEAMWREEDKFAEQAYDGLGKGEDVSEIGTSIILCAGKMHSFNVLGTEIWKLCDGKTAEEIVSGLREKFDVGEDVLREDVGDFLKGLKEEGLIYEK